MMKFDVFNDNIVLEPLLQMAAESSKNLDTIRTVVLKALSDPNVFCGFDEIKVALELKEDEVLSRTLDLFSYGKYLDYHNSETGRFLNLSTAQIYKLRQLTVLSLVQEACRTESSSIPYSNLVEALHVNDEKEKNAIVEEILISCIYAGLVSGQLCQIKQQLTLDSTITLCSRDVPTSETSTLLSQLKKISKRLDYTLEGITQDKTSVKNYKNANEAFWKKHEASTNPAIGTANQKMSDRHGAEASGSSFRSRDRPPPRASNKRSRGGLGGVDFGRF